MLRIFDGCIPTVLNFELAINMKDFGTQLLEHGASFATVGDSVTHSSVVGSVLKRTGHLFMFVNRSAISFLSSTC